MKRCVDSNKPKTWLWDSVIVNDLTKYHIKRSFNFLLVAISYLNILFETVFGSVVFIWFTYALVAWTIIYTVLIMIKSSVTNTIYIIHRYLKLIRNEVFGKIFNTQLLIIYIGNWKNTYKTFNDFRANSLFLLTIQTHSTNVCTYQI